ncbi:xanthine dehydrogenase small subunit [Bacteriovorax sp. DB6_IX]|uniref:xanthine dehydrogenase small subunit n=1 Tax=Bacteriovorax sp. DB6_IX TaxID=1353530 RepID=UPI000389FB8E|nr:FAD binding domain-containing protein [Bacteriovorax sp. DB6_IX]EQC50734.1 putative xanthine dehydrogenase, small subunit [Bacteriovorax sp. DB6_IX]
MRKSIIVYINGVRHELEGKAAFETVANYLRYTKGLTGTKVVCSEGDCGACTVLLSRFDGEKMGRVRTINSCISFMYLLDRCHLITVEGLKKVDHLHPVQEAMMKHHGAQCGYCTPGIVCSLASMTEDAINDHIEIDDKKVKNYLTGNLCRCTGYEPIIKAGVATDLEKVSTFSSLYGHAEMVKEFKELSSVDVAIESQNKKVFLPHSYQALFQHGNHANMKVTSGATDLGVLVNKGKIDLQEIVSLNNIQESYQIEDSSKEIIIGAKASLTDVEKACEKDFPEFSKKLHVFASPQIKNKGTLVGNLVNASPIGDTIPFLRVSGAKVVLHNGTNSRTIAIDDFFLGGYKELDLKDDEIVTKIILPKNNYEFKLYKVSIRKDLDISSVSMAIAYKMDGDIFTDFKIGIGGVGPTVMRISSIEKAIIGTTLDQNTFKKVAKLLDTEIKPLSDIRGSSDYRKLLSHNLLLKFCDEVIVESGKTLSEASV